jgi:hypothetical protein
MVESPHMGPVLGRTWCVLSARENSFSPEIIPVTLPWVVGPAAALPRGAPYRSTKRRLGFLLAGLTFALAVAAHAFCGGHRFVTQEWSSALVRFRNVGRFRNAIPFRRLSNAIICDLRRRMSSIRRSNLISITLGLLTVIDS